MFYEIILGVIDDQRTIIVLVHDQLNGKSIGQRTYYRLHRSSNQLVYQNYQYCSKRLSIFFLKLNDCLGLPVKTCQLMIWNSRKKKTIQQLKKKKT